MARNSRRFFNEDNEDKSQILFSLILINLRFFPVAIGKISLISLPLSNKDVKLVIFDKSGTTVIKLLFKNNVFNLFKLMS